MKKCPFLEDGFLTKRCKSIDDEIDYSDYDEYCTEGIITEKPWKECPYYKDKIDTDEGCYITTACMKNMLDEFYDNCYELETIRKFRDEYVKGNYYDSVIEYYFIAPKIVRYIENSDDKEKIYENIYNELVCTCCSLIENKKYKEAYELYRNYTEQLRVLLGIDL